MSKYIVELKLAVLVEAVDADEALVKAGTTGVIVDDVDVDVLKGLTTVMIGEV